MNLFSDEFRKPNPGISDEAMAMLDKYNWPGNVRELRNCIARAMILNEGNIIRPGDLDISVRNNQPLGEPESSDQTPVVEWEGDERFSVKVDLHVSECSLDNITTEVLRAALEKCENNKSKAANLLKVDRRMFNRCDPKNA
jgi:DNA-binding NtrC family response regulator